ncbi:MAG TPA: phytoene/squalene synthase family protein [Chitinophagales bacterium]|nr:phytoene/squalene synthase family protein [Chitinophagales bacterium]
MFKLFVKSSFDCSKIVTQQYSTSFSLGIKTLHPSLHAPIYGIYGFVRYADEIVDTFHDFDKKYLLDKFKADAYEAIKSGISLNPILFAFQKVVNDYKIPLNLVEAFFKSMEMDLYRTGYGREGYDEYIYGSAEAVGLMCLRVFVNGDETLFKSLEPAACALGAAFQKVNFLRDMKSDFDERGRVYFPGVNFNNFGEEAKQMIEEEIAYDFSMAYQGIIRLPDTAKAGVMLAYKYYLRLFNQIRHTPVSRIREARLRVPDFEKMLILLSTITGETLRNTAMRLFQGGQPLNRAY